MLFRHTERKEIIITGNPRCIPSRFLMKHAILKNTKPFIKMALNATEAKELFIL